MGRQWLSPAERTRIAIQQDCKRIKWLYEWGLTPKEIAREIGWSSGAVSKKLVQWGMGGHPCWELYARTSMGKARAKRKERQPGRYRGPHGLMLAETPAKREAAKQA